MTFAPPERPSHSAYPSSDHALVSPIESETQHWPQQPPITGAFGGEVLQAPKPEDHFYSSALGMGGPSDWEHLGDSQSLSPEMSSPPQAAAIDSHGPNMSSPPQMPADVVQTLPGYHEPAQPAAQDHAGSSLPDHPDSDGSYAPVQGINRTGTIDSVIQAWNVPLSVSAKPVQRLQSRPESRENIQGQPLERVVEVEKIVEKVVDPYSDLEPEFKASLKRYVAMLRKETAAATEEAKFEIFQAFIRKELRLRSMLYGVEVQDLSANGKTVNPSTRAVSDIPVLQEQMSAARAVAPSVASHTALAVEPPLLNARSSPNKHQDSAAHGNTEQLELSGSAQNDSTVQPRETLMGNEAETLPKSEPQRGGISEDSKASPARPATPPPPLKLEPLQLSHQAKDESVVVVDADDGDVEFSPGGRPRISRPQVVTNRSEQPAAGAAATAPDTQGSRLSPSADAPMVLEDYVMAGPPSPGANAPMLIELNSATDLPQVVTDGYGPVMDHAQRQAHSATEKKSSGGPAINFEPSRPAYQPFKYNPAVQAPTQPADESYSSLRKDAVDSGRLLVHEPLRPSDSLNGSRTSSPGLSRPQDEAFIGLIRSQSKAIRSKKPVTSDISTLPQLRPGTPRAPTLAAGTQAPKSSDLTTATSALRSMLPDSVPDSYGLSQHAKATALKAKVDAFSDNFSFIHETVVHWDRENRKVRVKQDEERDARQADSEAHIDGLFNDNEIGYADIGDLEADFKLVEAERKYQEDQQELEFFTREVYQPVTDRLQKELSELNTQYTLAVDLLDLESEPASRFLRPDSGKAEMGYVMSCVLSLFNKLELRHQKIAEADVERERRRKRLELTVLYTNGDNQGVRKLDQEFAVAEKMQVLHEARTKDTRANKLMDSFDRATVRGLGDNQTFVDDLLDRVRQLKEVILKDPANISQEVYAPQGPRDTMTLAQKAIDFVLADSQKLLTVSNVADKMLNEADYAVSVAEARVSNAEQATYDKLAHEKEKEDAKIVEDTNARMSSIGKAPADAVALIREVVDKVGDDAEHQERIMKALEAAKQRNAVTEAG